MQNGEFIKKICLYTDEMDFHILGMLFESVVPLTITNACPVYSYEFQERSIGINKSLAEERTDGGKPGPSRTRRRIEKPPAKKGSNSTRNEQLYLSEKCGQKGENLLHSPEGRKFSLSPSLLWNLPASALLECEHQSLSTSSFFLESSVLRGLVLKRYK